jgi:hypothetical protein
MHSLVDQVVAAVADLQARGGVHQLAVICDGKPSIWTAAARIPEFAGAIHILDFYHAMEHVMAVAKVICGGNEVAAKRLAETWREKLQLEHDGVDKIIRSLKYYTSTRQLGTEQRRVLLRARKHFMKPEVAFLAGLNRTNAPFLACTQRSGLTPLVARRPPLRCDRESSSGMKRA